MERFDDLFPRLLSRFASLSSFAEIARWDAEATTAIQKLSSNIEVTNQQISDLEHQTAAAYKTRKQRSFFLRLFRSSEEKTLARNIAEKRKAKINYGKLTEELQERINATPKNREEQAAAIKDLKLKKKELQLEKKEVSVAMQSIRTDARKKSSDAATSFGALVGGKKYTAAERKNIRQEKEAALTPQENTKSAIERQLLSIDKEILRLEAFQ